MRSASPIGRSMGLIVLPQALKIVIPGIVNTFISLFKDTTLVSIIGLFDLLGIVQAGFQDPKWASPQTGADGLFRGRPDLLGVLLRHVALFAIHGAATHHHAIGADRATRGNNGQRRNHARIPRFPTKWPSRSPA